MHRVRFLQTKAGGFGSKASPSTVGVIVNEVSALLTFFAKFCSYKSPLCKQNLDTNVSDFDKLTEVTEAKVTKVYKNLTR